MKAFCHDKLCKLGCTTMLMRCFIGMVTKLLSPALFSRALFSTQNQYLIIIKTKNVMFFSFYYLPALSYSWYKNFYVNFIFSNKKPHIFISNDGKLYFSQVTKDDGGNYVCIVSVPGIKGGKHSQPIQLDIIETSMEPLAQK